MKAWPDIVEDVQGYLSSGIRPLPLVYSRFLEALMEMEYRKLVCVLPSPRFELYHIKLERRVRSRIATQEQRKAA